MPWKRLGEDSHLRVRQGEPTLIGYGFYDGQGHRWGTVIDLLVDKGTMRVPFASVVIDQPGQPDRRIFVPIWEMHIDPENRRLVCEACDARWMQHFLPDTGGEPPPELRSRFEVTFLARLAPEERPALPPGTGRREVYHDAKTQIAVDLLHLVECVDKVRLYDKPFKGRLTEVDVCRMQEPKQ